MRAARLLFFSVFVACGSSPKASTAPHPHTPPVASALPTASSKCIAPDLGAELARGIDLYLDDRLVEAGAAFDGVAKEDPRNRAAEFFREATMSRRASTLDRARVDVEGIAAVRLEALPTSRTQRHELPLPAGLPKIRLERVSEKKNAITDGDLWEKNVGVASTIDPERVPGHVPEQVGNERRRWVDVRDDYAIGSFGDRVVITGDDTKPLVFDARAAMRVVKDRAFDVSFARLVGRSLVLGLGTGGYAKDADGKTGYVGAWDIASGTLLWSTDPLTANAAETVIAGGSLVTGYGFTAEPDFLFVLDLRTGAVDAKIPLKSGPEHLRPRGSELFVRTYDTDVVFRAQPGLPPPPAPALERTNDPHVAISPAERCWVRRATAALATRDRRRLDDALDGLANESRSRELYDALRRESGRLGQTWRIDLTAVPLLKVAAPEWALRHDTARPTFKLMKTKSEKPTTPMGQRFGDPFSEAKGRTFGPAGVRTEGTKADVPPSYGADDLDFVVEAPGARLAVYGSRYVAVLRADKAEVVLDLDALRRPPTPRDAAIEVTQKVSYAERDGDMLYVCNGSIPLAPAVGPRGLITAIEIPSGRIRWRSEPLVCNDLFASIGEHLASAYGGAGEPSSVVLLRKTDGAVEARTPLAKPPRHIGVHDGAVRVEGDDFAIEYAVAPAK